MKVFVSFDMEGVAGIVDWSQCQPSGGAAYQQGCELLLGEVNAAIEGALAGGADEVVLNDSHGAMFNLDPGQLREPATYISGRHKPDYMMEGLDGGYGAVFFVGYHGSISGEASTLSHTYNPEVVSGVRLNGEYVGESGINALVACALAEAERIAPDSVTVRTKQSRSRFSAHHLHPAVARTRIKDGACEAIQAVAAGNIGTPRIELPATLDIEFQNSDMAEMASWVKGVERTGVRTAQASGSSGMSLFRSFVAVTYIARQAGGR
jgi:D-amino peptidase